ncbi:hypothetical protein P43SY_005329 [Pythium insidiosum]|uniref:Beta-lactamase-related domain-containing protein n=1 Tax=Pythium insidiosum TaxID=114742 RepID=A0AAD5M8Y8_PYTIN|nr:hypothetical protein P43SY_005329 [Pythium insidiosum]
MQAAAEERQRLQRRRRRRLMGVGAAVFTVAVVAVLGVSGVWHAGTQSRYDAAMTKFLETSDFDGVVLVSENGKTLFEHVGGLANEEFQVPMKVDDIFPVASNSKLFTAVSLYQLQERGLVNLTDPRKLFIITAR